MKKFAVPELLAPAGTPGCALAAFDAGADAIYAGLPKFNARERGENFTADSMGRIIEYAHKNRKKVYVTLNTLIKEKELPEIAEYLALLSDLGPDALIVQDLGVIRMAREYFPNLVLHGSTQMGIHNRAGADFAKQLGLKRIILERQLTFEEIDVIAKHTDLEMEVFIHGALCCSLSGLCYFSSYLGGYSGNRGKCKQPCRRRYFSKNGNGFFFSPQDLCCAENLLEFKKRGIASLKIEGRLKQTDYVTETVGAYRMLLDAPEENFKEALSEAKQKLSKTCGRRWSTGFLQREGFRTLISHTAIGAAGMLCGNIVELRDNGFAMETKKRLFLGDRIRIQPRSGDDGPSLTVTKMFVNNAPVHKAVAGDRVFICCDKEVPPNGTVYKIGESLADYTGRIASLEAPKAKLDLDVCVTSGGIRIAVKNAPCKDFEKRLELAPSQKHPLDQAALEKEFAAADSETLGLGKLDCRIDGEYFMPQSVLKEIRRNFWDQVKSEVKPESVFRTSAEGLEKFRHDYVSSKISYVLPEHLTETVAICGDGAEPANRKAIRAMNVFEFNKLAKEVILPEFCAPEKQIPLEKAVERARESGIRRFRIESVYALGMFRKQPGEVLIASSPLPVCNSMAVQELARFGVDRVMAHVELEREAIEELIKHSILPVEVYRLGRPAILTSRAGIPADGSITDARGNAFRVKYTRADGLTRVYPEIIFSIPRLAGAYDFYDLRNANWNAPETGTFNFENVLY